MVALAAATEVQREPGEVIQNLRLDLAFTRVRSLVIKKNACRLCNMEPLFPTLKKKMFLVLSVFLNKFNLINLNCYVMALRNYNLPASACVVRSHIEANASRS